MTYLIVCEYDGSAHYVEERDLAQITEALHTYLETGRACIVHLTMTSGAPYLCKSQDIASVLLSAPETRARAISLRGERADEERLHRADAGLPWEDGDEDGEEDGG